MYWKSCQWLNYQIGTAKWLVQSSDSLGWADQWVDTIVWHAHLGSIGGLLGGKLRQALTFFGLLQVVFCQSSLWQAGEGDILFSHPWIFRLARWAALGDRNLGDTNPSCLGLNQVLQNGALASRCLGSLCYLSKESNSEVLRCTNHSIYSFIKTCQSHRSNTRFLDGKGKIWRYSQLFTSVTHQVGDVSRLHLVLEVGNDSFLEVDRPLRLILGNDHVPDFTCFAVNTENDRAGQNLCVFCGNLHFW